MLTGWFKCPAVAWQRVRGTIPKPWAYDCMVADVRWWNDQLKMGRQATPPAHEQLASEWGISLDEVYQICDEVTGEGQRKPPRAPASRGLSDQTTDQTTHLKSVSGKSGSGAREPAAGSNEPNAELVALMAHLKGETSSDD